MFRRNRKLAARETEIHAPDGLEVLDMADVPTDSAAIATIAKLFDVYQPGAVFSEPTTVGDNTVITASEVSIGMGVGFGRGAGGPEEANGEGSGVGGGGGAMGRPVAAIIVSPTGVRVEPIVDVTKIALAFFTTIGAMFMAWRAMRRQR